MLNYGRHPRSLVLVTVALLVATVVFGALSRRAVNDTNSLLGKPTEPLDTSSTGAMTAIAADGVPDDSALDGRTLAFPFHTVTPVLGEFGSVDQLVFSSATLVEGNLDGSPAPVAPLTSASFQDNARNLLESGGMTGSPVPPDELLDPGALSTAVAIDLVIGEPHPATPAATKQGRLWPNRLALLAALGLLPAALSSNTPVAFGFRAVLSEPAALAVLGVGLLAVGNQLRKARRARSSKA